MVKEDVKQVLHRIVILGSSGGNLRSHGGSDPARLIADTKKQIDAAGFILDDVQFVGAESSMDGISASTPAELWELRQGAPVVSASGTLEEVNAKARERDRQIAARVRAGDISGLILMSCDPDDTNSQAIAAAALKGIPVVGTGGTSIAKAQSLGANVVASSGTTGTNSATRAVANVSGLAKALGVKYRPVLGSSSAGGAAQDEAAWRRISIRGIMVGSIPAFICLALVLALSKIPVLGALTDVFDLLIASLPIVVAAVAARKISGLDEVGLVAGAVAGILAAPGGLLGGLVAGILSGLLAAFLIKWTLASHFPATTANIVTGALGGLIPGLVVYYLLAPFTALLGEWVKTAIEWALDVSPLLAGALAGLAMWPSIIGGVYHSVILPLVLLEMGQKGHSFFGAIDMVALVMTSLGITLANVIRPRTSGERALAGSGAAVNFFFGTFVESSYPFMFGDKKIFATALLAATAGGMAVGATGVEASAYLPAFLAPFISTNAVGLVLAMLTSFAIAFALTFATNTIHLKQSKQNAADRSDA